MLTGCTVALVGEDHGALNEARRRAAALGVALFVQDEYVDQAELCAAICAADVVVCPYEIASASGVLVLAAMAGTPSVSSSAGGLSEYATETFAGSLPGSLAQAIESALMVKLIPWSEDDSLADSYKEIHDSVSPRGSRSELVLTCTRSS
jgi:glycosyltransferase involved in cell wall biosynthesis